MEEINKLIKELEIKIKETQSFKSGEITFDLEKLETIVKKRIEKFSRGCSICNFRKDNNCIKFELYVAGNCICDNYKFNYKFNESVILQILQEYYGINNICYE